MTLSKTLVFNVTRSEAQLITPEKLHTPNEIKQLSDIDDQQGLRHLLPIIFFYPPLVGRNDDPVQILRDGLAKALVFYYPLAGRIIEGPDRKLMIDCNNEGVLFVEADANVKLEQLGDGILPPCPYMDELLCKVPEDSQGTIGCPLWLFQVTRFICGGFSLGIRFNHTTADGYGIMLFLNAMSELIKGASTPSIPPVWQRELLNARSPPRITCTHNEYLLNNINVNSDDSITYPDDTFIRTSIVFGPREIEALRNQLPATKIHSASRFDLITACIWKCRTISLEPCPADEIVRLGLVMNARKEGIMSSCLPTGYYGNAFTFPAAISRAGVLCESPSSYVVDLIQRAKAQMSEEYVRSVSDLMVIKGRPMQMMRWSFFVCFDITGLGFDKLDLGWGKPLFGGVTWATPFVSFYSILKNDERENIGVVVPICLPALALDKFQYQIKKMITTPQPNSKI